MRTCCVTTYAERCTAEHQPAHSIQPPLPPTHTTASLPQTHYQISAQPQNDTLLQLYNPWPSSNISCPSCCMQSHALLPISATQILLTNSQHTTSLPSQSQSILKSVLHLATHFTSYYPHLSNPHPPLIAQRCSYQIQSSP